MEHKTQETTITVELMGRELDLEGTLYNNTIALIPHLAVPGNCLIAHKDGTVFEASLARKYRGISQEVGQKAMDAIFAEFNEIDLIALSDRKYNLIDSIIQEQI